MVERKEGEEKEEKKERKKGKKGKSTKMQPMTGGRIINGGSCVNNSLHCFTLFFLSFWFCLCLFIYFDPPSNSSSE